MQQTRPQIPESAIIARLYLPFTMKGIMAALNAIEGSVCPHARILPEPATGCIAIFDPQCVPEYYDPKLPAPKLRGNAKKHQ